MYVFPLHEKKRRYLAEKGKLFVTSGAWFHAFITAYHLPRRYHLPNWELRHVDNRLNAPVQLDNITVLQILLPELEVNGELHNDYTKDTVYECILMKNVTEFIILTLWRINFM
jgi:hypothetical protein